MYEFLHDVDLIFVNARIYNVGDYGFLQLCDYMEEVFVAQLDKIEPRITPEVYKIITKTNIPKQGHDARQFSITRLEMVISELMELPEKDISECVYFLLEQKNELNLIHGADVVLRFHNCSYELLERFERMVQQRRAAHARTPAGAVAYQRAGRGRRRGARR